VIVFTMTSAAAFASNWKMAENQVRRTFTAIEESESALQAPGGAGE